mgnify:CR=1 FL=1
MIDLDPQGNGTTGCGVEKHMLDASVYELLLGLKTFEEVVRHSEAGFDVLPANRELSGAEVELVSFADRDLRLKKALSGVIGKYDYILIDCPPSLSMLTLNALCFADGVIIPMQCEYFALEGLTDLSDPSSVCMETKMRLAHYFDSASDVRSENHAAATSERTAKKTFRRKVFDTVIPRNVRLAEAPSYGKPGVTYDRSSKGAKAYMAFADEILTRLEGGASQRKAERR